jgi:hypothetical protein
MGPAKKFVPRRGELQNDARSGMRLEAHEQESQPSTAKMAQSVYGHARRERRVVACRTCVT